MSATTPSTSRPVSSARSGPSHSDTPTARRIRNGVANVLAARGFRRRAQELQAAYTRYSGAARAAESILEVAAVHTPVA